MNPMRHFSVYDWAFIPTSENTVKIDLEEDESENEEDCYLE